MDGDLRVVGARLDHEVATAARRVELIALEPRKVDERGGPAGGQTGTREEAGTEAEGQGETGGRQRQRLAGVLRRCVEHRGRGAALDGLQPARHPLGGGGPAAQHPHDRRPVARPQVEGGHVEPVLHGAGDAGLMVAAEGHCGARAGGRLGVPGADRPGGARGAGDDGAAQQAEGGPP